MAPERRNLMSGAITNTKHSQPEVWYQPQTNKLKHTWSLKALANQGTFLQTHCCRHKCFLVCPCAQHLLQTQILNLCPGHKKRFPSLRSPRNIMGNNVSTTMCPRLLMAIRYPLLGWLMEPTDIKAKMPGYIFYKKLVCHGGF